MAARAIESETDALARTFGRQRASRWAAKASTTAERMTKLGRLREAVLEQASMFNVVLAADLSRPAAFASHAFASTLPLGGVGNSARGQYHGVFGFRELSHARAVVTLPRPFDSVAAISG